MDIKCSPFLSIHMVFIIKSVQDHVSEHALYEVFGYQGNLPTQVSKVVSEFWSVLLNC